MDAITLWQPWATFIALRLKRIETRTHSKLFCLLHRRIAIHAGLQWDDDGEAAALDVCRYDAKEDVKRAVRIARGQRGMVLCTAVVRETRIIGSRDAEAALCEVDYSNRYGLVLSEIERLLAPVPATGHQGIWQWTPGQEQQRIVAAKPNAQQQQMLF